MEESTPKFMPSTAIKISPILAEQARAAAEHADRSMAGQIEHWARLGQAVEPQLPVAAIAALKKAGALDQPVDWAAENAKALKILADFRDNPKHEAMAAHLRSLGKPLYSVNPDDPDGSKGTIIQSLPDGTRRVGKLVNRVFVPLD